MNKRTVTQADGQCDFYLPPFEANKIQSILDEAALFVIPAEPKQPVSELGRLFLALTS